MEEDTKNKKVVATLTIATILSIICCITLIIVAAHKPDSPEFCAKCHSMESSFNSWKDTVTCNTGCLDCHTHDNSGKTLSVEIIDHNCTKSSCHPVEKLNSNTSKYMENIFFKHETHLKEFASNLKLKCIGCHSYSGKDDNGRGKIKHFSIDENACFVCHFTKSSTPLLVNKDYEKDKDDIDNCLLCHKDVQAKVRIYEKEFDHLKYEKVLKVECTNCHFEIVNGNGDTNKKDCYYCHTKIPNDYTDTERMHNDHVRKHKVPCSPCHDEIHHEWSNEFIYDVLPHRNLEVLNKYWMRSLNVDKGIEPDTLSGSRKGRNVFDKGPYLLQREIYRGVSGRGIAGSPDPMYLATVGCIACHQGEDFTVDPKTCNSCHEKGFDKTMLEQKEYVKNMLAKLSSLIKDLEAQGIPKDRINGVKRNYSLIVADGSYGVHNIKYIKDLITYSIDRLHLIQEEESPEIISVVLPVEDGTLIEGSWEVPETEVKVRIMNISKIPASKKIGEKLPTEVSISEKENKSLSNETPDTKLPTLRRTHTVGHGDTLWKLALEYYNDSSKWGKIYNANKDTIENKNSLKIGQRLIIPE